ncbi:MAG: hypothetical protein JWQ71_2302 [Pedosphaera sp.]|nr:hypothetical protein [Pedosphaera sp.]
MFLLAGLLWLNGCGQSQSNAPSGSASVDPRIPTAAQPRLKTIKLWIGSEEMTAEMALTEVEERTGMMFRTNVAEGEGMLFVFPEPHRASFWMMNTLAPLSAAYISSDGVIQELHELEPQNTNSVVAATDNIQFVLETKQGWFKRHNIEPGAAVSTEYGPLNKVFSFKPQ